MNYLTETPDKNISFRLDITQLIKFSSVALLLISPSLVPSTAIAESLSRKYFSLL